MPVSCHLQSQSLKDNQTLTTMLPSQTLTVYLKGPGRVVISGVQTAANVTQADIVADKVGSSRSMVLTLRDQKLFQAQPVSPEGVKLWACPASTCACRVRGPFRGSSVQSPWLRQSMQMSLHLDLAARIAGRKRCAGGGDRCVHTLLDSSAPLQAIVHVVDTVLLPSKESLNGGAAPAPAPMMAMGMMMAPMAAKPAAMAPMAT